MMDRISNFEMKIHLNQSGGGLRNLELKYNFLSLGIPRYICILEMEENKFLKIKGRKERMKYS